MGLKLGDIAQDVKAETGGVWRESPWGGEFLIGREGNREYRREVRRLAEAAREKATPKGRDLTPEEWSALHVQATARCVLLGWRDVAGEDGKALAYSPEVAATLLADERFADLAEWVVATARDAAAYRIKARKDAEGNSGTPSGGA